MDKAKGLVLRSSNSTNKTNNNRFRWKSPLWIEFLLKNLAAQALDGGKSDSGFKSSALSTCARALNEEYGINIEGKQVFNQLRSLRSHWNHLMALKNMKETSWDENKKKIVMGEKEYTLHVQAYPKDSQWLNKPIPFWEELEIVCGDGHASGRSNKPLREAMDLPADDFMKPITIHSSEPVAADNQALSAPVEVEAEAGADSYQAPSAAANLTGASSSAARSGSKRPRSKRSTMRDEETKMLQLIAMSFSQIAKSLQHVDEAALYSDLYADLTSMEGFGDEEVDRMYDFLSQDVSKVKAWMVRPKASKARFMRQWLDKNPSQ